MSDQHFSDFQVGIHSQIPPCCVHFYCEMLSAGGEILLARINEWRRRQYPGQRFSIGYVPCSECWKRITTGLQTPQQLHVCRDPSTDPICAFVLGARAQRSNSPARHR